MDLHVISRHKKSTCPLDVSSKDKRCSSSPCGATLLDAAFLAIRPLIGMQKHPRPCNAGARQRILGGSLSPCPQGSIYPVRISAGIPASPALCKRALRFYLPVCGFIKDTTKMRICQPWGKKRQALMLHSVVYAFSALYDVVVFLVHCEGQASSGPLDSSILSFVSRSYCVGASFLAQPQKQAQEPAKRASGSFQRFYARRHENTRFKTKSRSEPSGSVRGLPP